MENVVIKNGDTYEGNYVNAKKEGFGIYFLL